MALELRVLLVETTTGDRGWAETALDSEAMRLTPVSFQTQYAMPLIAQAWLALADAVEKRRLKAESVVLVNGS